MQLEELQETVRTPKREEEKQKAIDQHGRFLLQQDGVSSNEAEKTYIVSEKR